MATPVGTKQIFIDLMHADALTHTHSHKHTEK